MYGKAEHQDLSRSQFDSARLGFFQLLRRKRMSPQFIDRHGEDLFAQACFEYSRRATEVEIGDPPAWIVTCGWNRTVSLLETRDYKPRLVSTESIAEPVDRAPGPEEALLDEDRARKVRSAVEELPLYQRELLALSYFEGESIREAGRRLGWTPSKAQRAHEAAQKRISRIFEMLDITSTDDIQLEVGFFAFLSICADRASGHTLPAGLEATLDSVHHRLSEAGHGAISLVRRPLAGPENPGHPLAQPAATVTDRTGELGARGPFGRIADLGRRLATGGVGEAGTAIAGEGGSRALEVCKGLAVCVLGGSAITTALIGGGGHTDRPIAHHQPPAKVVRHARPARDPVLEAAVPRTAPDAGEAVVAGTRSSLSKPVERHPAASKAPKVTEAVTATPTVTANAAGVGDQTSREAKTETQFQNFDATEESGGTPEAAKATSVTNSATSAGPESSTPTASPARKAEEAKAAKDIHGLLE